ncbi:MAG: hypothetical protein H0X59_05415 [Chloroflexi bacterium]|nr:hypothetical protein [Chloroflexota bacterium]
MRIARVLLWVAAVALLSLGVAAWLFPDRASEQFPWSVSPFLAMTIGGWSIGTGLFAADAARDPRRDRAYPLVTYLGVFSLGQLLVVLAFADRLRLGVILTWPYLLGLGTALAGSVLAAVAWRQAAGDRDIDRDGNRRRSDGRSVPGWARVVVALFTLFVGSLALGTFIAGPEGAIAQGRVFPEPMSLFSIRAFSAFLFALTVASASLLVARRALPYHELARAGMYLLLPITFASLLNLDVFTVEGPLTFFYLASYVLVTLGLGWVLWAQRDDPALHPRREDHTPASP